MAFTANPLLSVTSIFVLPLFMILLWRQDEPPVLLFAVFFQWVQVSSKVFHANLLGLPLEEFSQIRTIDSAVWLGLIGLVILVFGIHVVIRHINVNRSQSNLELDQISISRVFIVCFVATVLTQFVFEFGALPLKFKQIFLTIMSLRWAFVYILGYLVIKRKQYYHYYAIIFGLELVAGIGFFAGFKSILFVTLIVLFTTSFPIKLKTFVLTSAVVVTLLLTGLAWTSIKEEYRNYLNQGSGQQEVRVGKAEQLKKIGELVGELDGNDLKNAAEPMFHRLAYVDYFAKAIEYVPNYAPYERGSLWGASILHVLRPRILFPDKPILPSDSEITMQYTGEMLASGQQGTSISLGYMAENYIDFGRYGMFAPILLLGMLWGFVYLYFVTRPRMLLFAYGFTTTILIHTYQFEMAGIKLLGTVLSKFILMAVIFYAFMPKIMRWFDYSISTNQAT